jgi:signal transduction histidine kinase
MAHHTTTFLLVTILVLVVILLIFGMKYFSAARTAHLKITSEDAYRDLADRVVKVQEESVLALSDLKESVKLVEDRLGRIEKLLKEVE